MDSTTLIATGIMPDIHSQSSSSLLSSSPCKRFSCHAQGGSLVEEDDVQELQTDPRDPVFVNHAAHLLSSVDLDAWTQQSAIRDVTSDAEAILSLQVILSSVFRSASYSPPERVTTLREIRSELAARYRVPTGFLDGVLSKPFRSLDGITPLEFEIQRWSPVWGGKVGEGVDSPGIATILFLIDHWNPYYHRVHHNIANETCGLDQDVPDPHHELINLVRNSCLRRLDSLRKEPSGPSEDNVNMLFQRTVQAILSRDVDSENAFPSIQQTSAIVGSREYKVSVASSTGRSVVTDGSDKAIEFTTLISIPKLAEQLNPPCGNDTASLMRGEVHGNLHSIIEHMSHLHRIRMSKKRRHPYSRPTSHVESRMGNSERSSSTYSALPPESIKGPSFIPSRGLLIEFIAVGRAWTLTIGPDQLDLSVHIQKPSSSPGSDPDRSGGSKSSTSNAMMVHAETRIVPSAESKSKFGPLEHVFTFPSMHILSNLYVQEDGSNAKLSNSCVSSCFFAEERRDTRDNNMNNNTVSRFDDARLLHGGELLLELRIRIQHLCSSQTDAPIDGAPSLAVKSLNRPGLTNDMVRTDNDHMSWSSISVPSKSDSFSDFVTVESQDLVSNPPSTLISEETDSSWNQI